MVIQRANLIVVPGETFLIGEVNGTWETLILVATLSRQESRRCAISHPLRLFGTKETEFAVATFFIAEV